MSKGQDKMPLEFFKSKLPYKWYLFSGQVNALLEFQNEMSWNCMTKLADWNLFFCVFYHWFLWDCVSSFERFVKWSKFHDLQLVTPCSKGYAGVKCSKSRYKKWKNILKLIIGCIFCGIPWHFKNHYSLNLVMLPFRKCPEFRYSASEFCL